MATGSVRRRAQLAWLRPDLSFVELRGNMATRLEKARQEGAGVVAVAALERSGRAGAMAEILSTGTLLPQVAQGALAVECRADHLETRALLEAIDDPVAHRAVTAERAFLAELGGGCTLPVGALASPSGASVAALGSVVGDQSEVSDGELSLEGLLASRDGRIVLRRTASGSDPAELGRRLAAELLDHGGLGLDDWGPVDDRSTEMTVYLVGAGPGDPGLLTRRGAEVLARAEVVVHDRLVLPGLLALAPPSALFVDVGKRPGEVGRQEEIHALLIEHGASKTVVRLKGGDPFLFGRGSEEVEVLRAAGIDYEVVPGVTLRFRRSRLRRGARHPPGLVDLGDGGDRPRGRPDRTRGSGLGGAGPGRRDPGHPDGDGEPGRDRPAPDRRGPVSGDPGSRRPVGDDPGRGFRPGDVWDSWKR